VTRYGLLNTCGAPAKLVSESATHIVLAEILFKPKSILLNRLCTGLVRSRLQPRGALLLNAIPSQAGKENGSKRPP
jgi:hypothetical protein